MIIARSVLAASVLFAAACSATNSVPSTGSMPSAPAGLVQHRVHVTAVTQQYQREAQAFGKMHPVAHRASFRAIGSPEYLWFADLDGAVWQTKVAAGAAGTGTTIVGGLFDCQSPYGIKFDRDRNLWVACLSSGEVFMYGPKSSRPTLVLHVNRTAGSQQIQAYPDDVARDNHGNVYVANEYTLAVGSQTPDVGEVDIFLAKSTCRGLPCNGATPDIVLENPDANIPCKKGGYCGIETGLSFLDLDVNGDVIQDFYDKVYDCVNRCKLVGKAIGVDLIRHPLEKKPLFRSLVRNMKLPGGVAVTSQGTVLNVLDSGTSMIARYTLFPFAAQGTLGPLPQQHFNACTAIGIGFNPELTMVAAGIRNCLAAAVGTVATNQFVAHRSINYGPLTGAAFEPSAP